MKSPDKNEPGKSANFEPKGPVLALEEPSEKVPMSDVDVAEIPLIYSRVAFQGTIKFIRTEGATAQ